MKDVVYILLATVLMACTSLLLGNAVLRAARAQLARAEALFLAFVLGSSLLAAVVFALGMAGLARRGAMLGTTVVLCAAAIWRGGHKFPDRVTSPLSKRWRIAFWAVYAVYAWLYASAALTPAAILDGNYLGDVAQYARAFRFLGSGAGFPDGSRTLFLYGVTIGHFSAAQTITLLYLLALPLGMRAYADRIGRPEAGVVAALLFFASPIAGRAGTVAAPDIILATVAFAFFYALQLRLRMPAMILFGFLAWTMTPWVLEEFDKPLLHFKGWYGRLPIDLAITGERPGSLLGPVFVLAPLALLALKSSAGRRLLLAALLFGAPCFGGMEPRAMLVGIPFLALAMALVLSEWRLAAPAALVAQAIFCWPSVVGLYVKGEPWRIKETEWNAALRIESDHDYLARKIPGYAVSPVLDKMVPDGELILALDPLPPVYHSRRVVQNRKLRERFLLGPPDPNLMPSAELKWVLMNTADHRTHKILERAGEWNLEPRLFDHGWLMFRVR